MVGVTRRQLLVLLVPVAALLVVAGQRLGGGSAGAGGAQRATTVRAVAEATAEERVQLVVHVSGAVERPGLYRVPEGSRVADLVRRAGGLKPRADLGVVNLAAPLADGEHVVVTRRVVIDPAAAGASGAGAANGGAGAPGAPVQLSTASVEQLDALPGIGPVTAAKIVDWRATHGPFRSVDDLDAIPGIGPSRVDQLRDLVVP